MEPTKPKPRTARKAPAKTSATKKTSTTRKARPKTLVTGGTGFLGWHLIHQLIEAGGQDLRVLTTKTPTWLAGLGVEIVEGSIISPEVVARAVEGATDIYHLAGRVSRDPRDGRQMYAVHVEGTRLLCEAAAEAGVRNIVLASSSGTIAVTEDGDKVADETWPVPLDIISRWPYYASKLYQEQVALEGFSGEGRRLVILNPSLLLGPGDERLSSTKVVLDFLARRIRAVPSGGLNFVDVRDAARAFRQAMQHGRHGERYLLGAANWKFDKFFGRLERLTKIRGPRFSLPSGLAVSGARAVHSLYRHWNWAPPIEPAEIEMAEYFWYFDSSKAERELAFTPRDPGETLHDTVTYVRDNFLGSGALA